MECPHRYLYGTSANRSRHRTGAEDEPAHFRGDAIAREFSQEGDKDDVLVLHHASDDNARDAHPHHDPMSTTFLALHRLGAAASAATTTNATNNDDVNSAAAAVGGGGGGGRPSLIVERHGSLPLETLRPLVARLGFDLELGPKAARRLALRSYDDDDDGGGGGGEGSGDNADDQDDIDVPHESESKSCVADVAGDQQPAELDAGGSRTDGDESAGGAAASDATVSGSSRSRPS